MAARRGASRAPGGDGHVQATAAGESEQEPVRQPWLAPEPSGATAAAVAKDQRAKGRRPVWLRSEAAADQPAAGVDFGHRALQEGLRERYW